MRHPLDESCQALLTLERVVPERPGAVLVERRDGITWFLLDNPRAHNALTVTMMRQLAEAVRDLAEASPGIVAVASAHGSTFCAGGHLGQVREALVDPQAARLMSESMQTVLDALLDLPHLSVAVLEGAAIGGGVELASACDLRVGTAEAVVHAAQVRLGVTCGWGGAARLVRHLGRRQALRLLTRSEPLDAVAAREIGMLDAIASGDRMALVHAAVGNALHHPAASVGAAKEQIVDAEHDRGEAAEIFLSVWGGADHRAALQK